MANMYADKDADDMMIELQQQYNHNPAMLNRGLAAQLQKSAQLQELAGQGQLGFQDKSPKRPPEVQVAASTLNERVSILAKELAVLEQRLEAVLRPQPPQTSTPANIATPSYGAQTQLGQSIAQATGNIDVAINRVRGMLDLLEL